MVAALRCAQNKKKAVRAVVVVRWHQLGSTVVVHVRDIDHSVQLRSPVQKVGTAEGSSAQAHYVQACPARSLRALSLFLSQSSLDARSLRWHSGGAQSERI